MPDQPQCPVCQRWNSNPVEPLCLTCKDLASLLFYVQKRIEELPGTQRLWKYGWQENPTVYDAMRDFYRWRYRSLEPNLRPTGEPPYFHTEGGKLMTLAKALEIFITNLQRDPEYAWQWHCAVAMAMQDQGVSWPVANLGAARFMSTALLTDTETRVRSMLKDKDSHD